MRKSATTAIFRVTPKPESGELVALIGVVLSGRARCMELRAIAEVLLRYVAIAIVLGVDEALLFDDNKRYQRDYGSNDVNWLWISTAAVEWHDCWNGKLKKLLVKFSKGIIIKICYFDGVVWSAYMYRYIVNKGDLKMLENAWIKQGILNALIEQCKFIIASKVGHFLLSVD